MRSSLRPTFKYLLLICLATGLLSCGHPPLQVMTVTGPISADELGTTLIHEHVFLDWAGADSIDPSQWNEAEAYEQILPQLQALKQHGVQTFLECTPAYLGRNPELLQRLSQSTGLHIITNTGYYGARKNKHIPTSAYALDADELAAEWIREAKEGIGKTGIRPGFMKIGVDADSLLSNEHKKLIRAAARAHKSTGLTIVSHTGPDAPAFAQLKILAEEGIGPQAFVWTHAQSGTPAAHVELAKRGAWISLDGMGWMAPDSVEREGAMTLANYIDRIQNLREHQLLNRLLISHDAGWYTHGEVAGGEYRPHTDIFTRLIPALDSLGFSQEELDQLLIKNPREAYAIRVRKRMY